MDWRSEPETLESARLLRILLELAITERDPASAIEDAISQTIVACRAQVAYVELRDGDRCVFECAAGDLSQVEAFRTETSRTIAARVLTTGNIEHTVAISDERFADADSVRRNEIAAVLCAPISLPPIGVLYLHRRRSSEPFDDDDRHMVELFARVVAKFATPVIVNATRPLSADVDQVESQRIRAALQRHSNNKSAVAEELGIDRSTLYRKMKNLGIDCCNVATRRRSRVLQKRESTLSRVIEARAPCEVASTRRSSKQRSFGKTGGGRLGSCSVEPGSPEPSHCPSLDGVLASPVSRRNQINR